MRSEPWNFYIISLQSVSIFIKKKNKQKLQIPPAHIYERKHAHKDAWSGCCINNALCLGDQSHVKTLRDFSQHLLVPTRLSFLRHPSLSHPGDGSKQCQVAHQTPQTPPACSGGTFPPSFVHFSPSSTHPPTHIPTHPRSTPTVLFAENLDWCPLSATIAKQANLECWRMRYRFLFVTGDCEGFIFLPPAEGTPGEVVSR